MIPLIVFKYFTGASVKRVSVYCKQLKCTYKDDVLDPEATAYGVFNDTIETLGWGILELKAGMTKSADDVDVMFAAGYLEAVLTSE